MNTTYFVRTLFIGLFLFSASSSFASSGITFHGRLLMPDGVTPVSSATTQFRIQIRSPNAENCLLWEEQQTRDLSTTNGTFTLTIADTSEPSLIANVLPYTLERIFSNRTNFTGLTGCSVGSTFNPTSGDGRNLQVYFREVPTDPWEQMPLTKINFVPLSLNSIQLAGYDASEFLKIDPLSSYTTLTAANVNTLVDIISGATTQYLKPSSAFSGDVTGTSSTTVVEKIRGTNVVATAPTTGQVLKYDGTNWAPAADDTGSTGDASYAAKGIVQINTDQTTSGLFIASGVLAMPNVITAGGPTGGVSTVPVITYDQKGRLTAVTTATVDDTTKLPLAGGTMTGPINMGTQNIINATSVAATNFSGRNLILSDNDTNTVTIKTPTDVTADYVLTLPPNDGGAGEVLTTDGSGVLTWGSAGGSSISVTANQAVVANGTGTGLSSFTCSINQVMSFDGTGLPVCGNVTGAGGFIQNGNSYGAAATLGTNDNFDLNFETNGTTKMTVLAGGNLGVGTTNPAAKLDINGTGVFRDSVSIQPLAGAVSALTITNSMSTNTAAAAETIVATYNPIANSFSGALGGSKSTTTLNSGAFNQAVATGNYVAAYDASTNIISSGNTANAFGVKSTVTNLNSGAGALTNAYGVSSSVSNALGTLANAYGFYAGTIAGTNKFSFYASDATAPSYFAGNVGIGTTTPNTQLDITGAFSQRGMAAPALSVAGQGRIYFDSTANKFKVSENNGAYIDLVGGGGGGITGSGTTGKIPKWSSASALTDSLVSESGTTVSVTGSLAIENSAGTAMISTLGIPFLHRNGGLFMGGLNAPLNNTGSSNIGLGPIALQNVTSGTGNIAVGYSSQQSLTSGVDNTAVGDLSFQQMTTGIDNVGIGKEAGYNINIGAKNVGVGKGALYYSRAKSESTAVGYNSMFYAHSSGTAGKTNNTALGAYALRGGTNQILNSGTNNTAVGHSSLMTVTSGAGNIGLGYNSGSAITTGSNNVVIGSNTGSTIGTLSNYILLSDGSGTERLRIDNSGNVGIGTTSPNTQLDITGAFSQRGMAAPAASVAGEGRIYFDSTANKFKVSENNGAYVDLVGGGGGGTPGGAANTIQFNNAGSFGGIALTDGQLLVGSTGATPVAAGITGTSNQVTVTNGAGSITLSTPQDIHVGASPTFAGATLTGFSGPVKATSGVLSASAINLTTEVTGVLPVANGGTAASSFAANRMIASNGTGSALVAFNCALNEVVTFDASGIATCVNLSSSTGGYVRNGGNSFGAAATIGTNDTNDLNLETDNTTRMTISSTGNVGIGGAPVANTRVAIQGAAVSTTNVIASGATVDLSLSNIHLLKAPGASAITLQNPVDGGSYTLVISDTTSRTYTFSGCTNQYFSPMNSATFDQSTYNILVVVDGANTNCYITWMTGFN
jgi:trimeric autotransporter adhesin